MCAKFGVETSSLISMKLGAFIPDAVPCGAAVAEIGASCLEMHAVIV